MDGNALAGKVIRNRAVIERVELDRHVVRDAAIAQRSSPAANDRDLVVLDDEGEPIRAWIGGLRNLKLKCCLEASRHFLLLSQPGRASLVGERRR
jgi:hypothetical protein